MDRSYINLAQRVFNTPLLIHPDKLQVILAAVGDRFNVSVPDLKGDVEPLKREAFTTSFGVPRHEGGFFLDRGVAVVDISGTLVHKGRWIGSYSGLTSYEGIGEVMQRAVDSSDVKAIMLNLHTYGGEVAGCFDLCDLIHEARGSKPIVALVSDAAASAGYALASAADEIVVTQTAIAGSIGVVLTHYDMTKRAEDLGVKVTHIHAGKEKVLGSPFKPLSDSDRERLQASVDETYSLFVSKVARNRDIESEAVRATEAGVFGPTEAVKLGLADRVSTGRALLEEMQGRVKDTGASRLIQAQTKERSMSEATETKADGNQTPAAEQVVEGALLSTTDDTEAVAKAVGDERGRIKAILTCDAAEGRRELAEHLAFETDMAPEAAATLLAKSPAEKKSKLDAAMESAGTPNVGADAPAVDGEDQQIDAQVNAILKA